MRKLINLVLIITVATSILSCGSTKSDSNGNANTTISGTIEGGNGQNLLFELLKAKGITQLDTVKLDETGNFTFKTNVEGQGFYRLSFAPNNFVILILEEGENVTVYSNAKRLDYECQIQGSKESTRWQEYNRYVNSLYLSNDSVMQAMKMHQANRDINSYIGATQFQQSLGPKRDEFIRKFVDENPGSLASLAAVENIDMDQNYEYYKKVADALSKKIPNSPYFQSLNERVVAMSKLAIGAEAPEITMNTPDGETASLSSLRGKVVLLDFWASWCKPCRAENPNVVKMYQKYNYKGFEVFSVSLDKQKQAWVNAIQQDGLVWSNHVSDLQHWQSAAAKLYNISGIPQTYLLDQNGVIIGKNLRGPVLEQKLQELFGE